MIVGVCAAIGLSWVLTGPGITPDDPGIPLAGAIAMLAPFVVVPIVSLVTKPLDKSVVARAFSDSPPTS